MLGNDYEAPHTITADLARNLGRSVAESEVRSAFLSLASKGLVQAYVYDASIGEYVPISSIAASVEHSVWFMTNAEGRRAYEHEPT